MKQFGIHQPAKRKEDVRFLTGHGRYVDDLAPEGAAYAVFLRSPVAHADITTLDVSAARDVAGVLAVYTADDLAGKLENRMNFDVVNLPGGGKGAAPARPMMAEGRTRFVGEILACVIAESKTAGADAVELIDFAFDDVAVHTATTPGGETIHPEAPGNLAFDWHYGDAEATEAAFAGAAHHVTLDLVDNRVICNAMEPRACYSEMVDGRLHHAVNGQGVWGTRDTLAKKLGMAREDVRVTTPDVGGGFGMKAFDYPEQFLVSLAAKELGRAVRWTAERSEGMVSDNGGRDPGGADQLCVQSWRL